VGRIRGEESGRRCRYRETKLLATGNWAGPAKILYKIHPFSSRAVQTPQAHPAAHLHTSILSPFSIMGNLLYIIAVILIIIWALGFFGVMGAGIQGNSLIHILLVIAIIAILLRVISGRNPV
jgi:hypothetical protein